MNTTDADKKQTALNRQLVFGIIDSMDKVTPGGYFHSRSFTSRVLSMAWNVLGVLALCFLALWVFGSAP